MLVLPNGEEVLCHHKGDLTTCHLVTLVCKCGGDGVFMWKKSRFDPTHESFRSVRSGMAVIKCPKYGLV